MFYVIIEAIVKFNDGGYPIRKAGGAYVRTSKIQRTGKPFVCIGNNSADIKLWYVYHRID